MAISLFLLACSVNRGEPGPTGATGPAGVAGPSGAPGPAGATGPAGADGPAGPAGPQGVQGLQGPAGMVLIVDGGVVTGPAGASVAVTPITPGGTTCPEGGLRITQLSDGGVNSICNGATGAVGPPGAVGPAGTSVTATALSVLSPLCSAGGVLLGLPDGGRLPLCNGAVGATGPQGAAGPTGPTGATGAAGQQGPVGATGATGPRGPAGPTGPALFLDGGFATLNETPSFVGFTSQTYSGNLDGTVGANAKCNAEFPGSSLCTVSDFDRSNALTPPGATGAWLDSDRSTPNGTRTQNSCGSGGTAWINGTNADIGTNLNALGVFTGQVSCTQVKPIACCRIPTLFVFRGFTTLTFNGNLGGHIGANAKCNAEFPGSAFCTVADFDRANPIAAPGGVGAWVDSSRGTSGTRSQNSCTTSGTGWINGTSADIGTNLNALGVFTAQVSCALPKPLACCSYR